MPQFLVTEVHLCQGVPQDVELLSLTCLASLVWADNPAQAAQVAVKGWLTDHDKHDEWEGMAVKVTGPVDRHSYAWKSQTFKAVIQRAITVEVAEVGL